MREAGEVAVCKAERDGLRDRQASRIKRMSEAWTLLCGARALTLWRCDTMVL